MLTTQTAITLLQRGEERKDLAKYARIKMKCIGALKKTVPRLPINAIHNGDAGMWIGCCGTCGGSVNTDYQFCPTCGQRQDWRLGEWKQHMN